MKKETIIKKNLVKSTKKKTELERVKEALLRLAFLKTAENLKDIIFIDHVLRSYLRILTVVYQFDKIDDYDIPKTTRRKEEKK